MLALRERPLESPRCRPVLPVFWRHFGHGLDLPNANGMRIGNRMTPVWASAPEGRVSGLVVQVFLRVSQYRGRRLACDSQHEEMSLVLLEGDQVGEPLDGALRITGAPVSRARPDG